MERKCYNENSLWSVYADEATAWRGKQARVTLSDGSIISGIVTEIGLSANVENHDGIEEHLLVDIRVEKKIPICGIKTLEITNKEIEI